MLVISERFESAESDQGHQSADCFGSEVGTDVILSPDGTRLVFVSRGVDGVPRLNTRRLDESQVTQLSGLKAPAALSFPPKGNGSASGRQAS